MKGNLDNFKGEIFNKIEMTFKNYDNNFQNIMGNFPENENLKNNNLYNNFEKMLEK